VLHLKGLYCAKIVHIVAERAEGHRRGLGISCNCSQKLQYQRDRGSSREISLEVRWSLPVLWCAGHDKVLGFAWAVGVVGMEGPRVFLVSSVKDSVKVQTHHANAPRLPKQIRPMLPDRVASP
jgi:hypothetical protein